jgi:2',3'-cyclic-nucleotide 2'-phosphodiesterase/3'-nucleotidase
MRFLPPASSSCRRAGAPPSPRSRGCRRGQAELAVLETTDLHSNVVGYDYFKLAEDPSLGLDRTASLIAQARRDFPNTLLLDNGDTIQGNALGDYQATVRAGALRPAAGHPQGDEEARLRRRRRRQPRLQFRPGLPGPGDGPARGRRGCEVRKRCAGPGFPVVLANVYSVKTHKPLFAPYRIIDKRIKAVDATAARSRPRQGRHHRLHHAGHPELGQALAGREGLYRRAGRDREALPARDARQGRRRGGGDLARRPG